MKDLVEKLLEVFVPSGNRVPNGLSQIQRITYYPDSFLKTKGTVSIKQMGETFDPPSWVRASILKRHVRS